MLIKICSGLLVILLLLAGSALANTYIEYTLDGDWIYNEGYPGTLSLSENPAGGITATINVPTGVEDGGLEASRHDLPGFALDNNIFLELEYSSLTSTITGTTASLSLCLEVEFFDSQFNRYQMGMSFELTNESGIFTTWFTDEVNFDYEYVEPIPAGLSIDEGTLGLYFHDNYVSAYFKDVENNFLYPFLDWDISQIVGTHGFSVDNDFEATTLNGGTVNGSVNLEQVVFGVSVCDGDFDGDGDVDGSDLATFAADFGRTDCDQGEVCEGDFDGDNDVDGSNLAVFAADFGRTDCALCLDKDGDGYGEGALCLGPDCDDTDPSVYPGAAEVCGDGIDDDCDGEVDEECFTAEAWVDPFEQNFFEPEEYVWIFIELPAGYDPTGIDPASVRIGRWAVPEPDFLHFTDSDGDDILELQLMFTGFSFVHSLEPPEGIADLARYSVTGQTQTPEGIKGFQAVGTVNIDPHPQYLAAWPGPPRPSVQNPGFESDADSDGVPDRWWYFDADDANDVNDWNEGGFITPTWDSTQHHDGSYSAKITVAANCANGPDNGYRQWVAVTAGHTKTVSAWVKASGLTQNRATPGDRVTMELHFYNKHGHELAVPQGAWVISDVTDDADWTQISTSQFTIPANATCMEINVMLIVNATAQAPTGNGTIEAWFDDVSYE